MLGSQGGREPQLVRTRPDILVMFSDKDCFVVQPGRLVGTNEAKVIVVFGRQFYRKRHVQAVLEGETGDSFLAAWQESDKTGNPRAEAEMLQRLILMAGEMWRLQFLVSGDNLEKVLACVEHPETDTALCADRLWDYELKVADAMLAASQRLVFCPRTDGCAEESQLRIVLPPKTMIQFFRPDLDVQASLQNYLKFLLPKYYRGQAKFFNKHWDRRR